MASKKKVLQTLIALLSGKSWSSEPQYSSTLLQCGVTIQSDFPTNNAQPHQQWKESKKTPSFLLNWTKGNDSLLNGTVVLLSPQRKLQLSDWMFKKRLGKYQLPLQDFKTYPEVMSTFLTGLHSSDPVSLTLFPFTFVYSDQTAKQES